MMFIAPNENELYKHFADITEAVEALVAADVLMGQTQAS